MARALREGVELVDEELGDAREIDGLAFDSESAGIEARQVEQLGGELRQPFDLLAHAGEELLPGCLVHVLVVEELEVPAQREERRSQLVRRVRDELAARVLEARESLTHAVERTRELSKLVGAFVDDGLVEAAAGDAIGRPLEPADAPPEETCASVAEEKRDQKRDQRRDQKAPLDERHARK